MAKIQAKVKQRVGEIVRPEREFSELRDIAERGRSPTWQMTIALIAATIGATALGYLVVQLYFLPETIREARLNRVPGLTGMDLEDAIDKGEAAGYVIVVAGRDYSKDVGSDEVIFQDPPPDLYHPRGDTLRVLVSLGEPVETVPRVEGLELELARLVLGRMSLRVAAIRREASDVHPQGTVIRTEPAAGTSLGDVDEGAVTLVLSRGGSRLTMPDVRGLTLAQARDTLEVYSLMVDQVVGLGGVEIAPEGARVVVTGQEPTPGRLVPAGSAVDLTLGQAQPRRETIEPPPERRPLAPPPSAPIEEEPRVEEVPRQEAPPREPAADVPSPRPAPPDTSP
jgi:beta-lactam-binding protein with PASTA domain